MIQMVLVWNLLISLMENDEQQQENEACLLA